MPQGGTYSFYTPQLSTDVQFSHLVTLQGTPSKQDQESALFRIVCHALVDQCPYIGLSELMESMAQIREYYCELNNWKPAGALIDTLPESGMLVGEEVRRALSYSEE